MQIENRRAVITICLDSPVDKEQVSTHVGKGPRRKKEDYDDDDGGALYRESRFMVFFFCPFLTVYTK